MPLMLFWKDAWLHGQSGRGSGTLHYVIPEKQSSHASTVRL